ncbi:MAG: hypothetical protein L0Z53_03215, partial [Acidobacteriales bacterium]|nr:hypothetical protein [Terriglobales bacterium]
MASEKLSNLVDLAGGQVPLDLTYVVDVSAGLAGSKKSTLNDLLAEITKNITDLTVQFGDGAAGTVSAASKGKLRYDQSAVSAAGSFQVSENGAAYQNLIKGPASAGVLTANLLPFATAGDVVGDTALAQTGATANRVLTFTPNAPGTSITGSGYNSASVAIENQSGAQKASNLQLLGIPKLESVYYVGTFAAPTVGAALNAEIWRHNIRAQRSTTAGQTHTGAVVASYATETWSATLSGAAFLIQTQRNGITPGNPLTEFLINQQGTVHLWPTESFGTSTTGAKALFQVGGDPAAGAIVLDPNALNIFGPKNSVATDGKIVVIQQQNNNLSA